MGVCESENISPNLMKIAEEFKDLSIHEKIKNDYQIKSVIGEGGFGKIVIGIDKFGKKYAIKCIKKKKLIEAKFLANEVKIGIKVKHQNILGIKQIYEDINKIYLVMDYCGDGDLLEYITKSPNGKLDNINALEIIIQILDALNYLHNEVKICHRDLKPENCLIKNNGKKLSVKIIDFGVAEFINNSNKIKGKIGTPKYMAPEIMVRAFYNEKIDLWSAGIILFNMITGCEPYEFNTKEFNKKHIINTDINFDYIENEDIKELCKNLLEKNPNKRIDAKTALNKAKEIKNKILKLSSE